MCEAVLGAPDLAEDERYRTNELRVRNRGTLELAIEGLLSTSTADQVMALLEEADIPFGALNDLGQLAEHRQLAARERWFVTPSPSGPIWAMVDPMDFASATKVLGAVPALGEHTREVIDGLDAADLSAEAST